MSVKPVCLCDGVQICGTCRKIKDDPRYAALFTDPPEKPQARKIQSVGPRLSLKLSDRPKCDHFGDLNYSCSCTNSQRDVHYCNYKDAEWTRCWQSSHTHEDPDVASCHWCLYHESKDCKPDYRVELRAALAAPDVPLTGEGRGIVQCVGGTLYTTLAYLSVVALRETGCTLPIEWWHMGRHEFDPQMYKLAQQLGVRVCDASSVPRSQPIGGWELKPFSMLHSGFTEALFLDADNVVTKDPSFLFDNPDYDKHGAIFWPDLPPKIMKKWIPAVVWNMVGLPVPRRNILAFESGQLLVNRTRSSRALALTMKLNELSSVFYKVLYGDKDTFLLGWMMAEQKYAMPAKQPEWRDLCINQHDFDGGLLFQHNAGAKHEVCKGNGHEVFIQGAALQKGWQHLRQVWHGKVWSWRDQTEEESELARGLAGRWQYRTGKDVMRLQLTEGGGIFGTGTNTARRWTFRVLKGVPTLVLVGEGHKGSEIGMTFLTPSAECWKGRWNYHDRREVSLERLA